MDEDTDFRIYLPRAVALVIEHHKLHFHNYHIWLSSDNMDMNTSRKNRVQFPEMEIADEGLVRKAFKRSIDWRYFY